jgi:iron complex transport system substrate-binding protein
MEPNLDTKLSGGTPNLEDIVSRSPDLVLTNPTKHGDLAHRLIDLGIPALQYVAETPTEIKEAMLLTGEALGTETASRAQDFATYYDKMMTRIADATKAIADTDRLRIYFCGSSPLRAASGDMYQSLMVDAAGGASVSAGLRGYWNDVNIEQVLVWNPNVIIITSYGGLTPQQVLNDPDWQTIRAVKDGHVYKMPALAAAWDTPVPDSLLGIIWLAHALYPNEINIDLASECRAFYSNFYGYPLSNEEVTRLMGE